MERRAHVGWSERVSRVGSRITKLRDAISTPFQRHGVPFAPSPAGSTEPQGAPALSHEVGGPVSGYAGHDLLAV